MNCMTKDIPKNSQVSFRQLNTVSVVRATIVKRIYKINKMRCNLFLLVDILRMELFKFVFQMYSFVTLTCFSHM